MTKPLAEDQWLAWAKQLEAIASTGQHFSSDPFDAERYSQIAEISKRMLAALADVPLTRIENLVSEHATGYVTPSVDVRGAVFRGDQILLVQETSDGKWTLPGGFADIGRSASENVQKEIAEEAGIQVNVTELYQLRHMAQHEYKPDIRDFYKLFFLCEQQDAAEPRAGVETLAAEYFSLDTLPPLSPGRVILADIERAFEVRKQRDSGSGEQAFSRTGFD